MSAASSSKPPRSETEKSRSIEDLEAQIELLKADIARLSEHLAGAGQSSIHAAKRAAAEHMDAARAQGEAALDSLRSNARDIEVQLTDAVREKPITAIAVAAGVGYILALLDRR